MLWLLLHCWVTKQLSASSCKTDGLLAWLLLLLLLAQH
jgi:hypothetical protein